MAELVIFKSKGRSKTGWEPEPRETRRLADKLTAAFYEACTIGNLDAAEQFMMALEYEIERSARMGKNDDRDDGDDRSAVRQRYELERTRQQQAGTRHSQPEHNARATGTDVS